MINLKPFCDIHGIRDYIARPFSFGKFSYATNGHIIVRVDRRADVAEASVTGKWDAPLAFAPFETFSPIKLRLPRRIGRTGKCPDCDGLGCFDCGSDCARCDGVGDLDLESRTSTRVAGHNYSLKYVRLMMALPQIEIAPASAVVGGAPADMLPLLFRFAGGLGAVCPLRSAYTRHIEV